MRRILVAECIHEICSFNPVPTRYTDFFVHTSEGMLAYHRDIGSIRLAADTRGTVRAAAGRSSRWTRG